ncbi:hypothetical protein C0992_001810, partial [Termitomyces sp. T32_za158]
VNQLPRRTASRRWCSRPCSRSCRHSSRRFCGSKLGSAIFRGAWKRWRAASRYWRRWGVESPNWN